MREITARVGGWFISFWVLMWLLGLVLAQGFISTTVTIFFFPWAWYLAVERLAVVLGIL